MSETQNSKGGDHIVLLPFMAQGHLNPSTAMARLLEQHTQYTITIISTPLNIKHLRSHLPPNTTIRLASLPFNSSDHGLPPNCESTKAVPRHITHLIAQASESLQPAFDSLISSMCSGGSRPLCIISDVLMSWSIKSAIKFGIFNAVFYTAGAYSWVILRSLYTHLPRERSNADEFSFPGSSNIIDGDIETDPWSLFYHRCLSFAGQSDGFLINTVEELESKALEQLRKNVERRVWAIGPLLSPPSSTTTTTSSTSCIEWLNLHPPNSVLYISFGSENSIKTSPMMELAKGLEALGKPFIWVIRPPDGFDVHEEFRTEWLPEDFEARIAERKQGILVKEWAPQLEILSHKSTAAFLSHCGWNSTLESLSRGVPIIGWPIAADQLYNSKQLEEELGVGVEMATGNDAETCGADVVKVCGLVMDGGSGKGMEMRRNAKRIEQLMKAAVRVDGSTKGSSVNALEDLIQMALASRNNT